MLSDFELYCAICGGPLSTANCEIADPDSPTYPKIRVWIVNRRLERRPGEDLRKIRRICAEISGRDWYDEEYNSYDPGVISVEDLAWLEDVCILGLDPDGEDGPRAFLYESAVEEDWGVIRATVEGKTRRFKGYDNENYPSPPVYPFHRCCFDILCKAFDHEIGTPGGLVHRALYDLMDGLNGSMNAELGLIYDDAEGRTQTWMSVIGEEYSVADPSFAGPEVLHALERQARRLTLVNANQGTSQPDSLAVDGFDKLPREILHTVMEKLDLEDLRSLMEASSDVYSASQDNIFWKRYMLSTMPWFSQLHELTARGLLPTEPDYRRFCLQANETSQRDSTAVGEFAKLPNEMLHAIIEKLDLEDVQNLIEASRAVYLASRDNTFWKRYILSAMPWFWELRELITSGVLPANTDYRRLCLWADHEISVRLGMGKPFLGVAHRRRIWHVWTTVAHMYPERLEMKPAGCDDESAEEIREVMFEGNIQAAGLTRWPTNCTETETRIVRSQWVHSWEEVDEQAALLETYFDHDGFMVGMSVSFGDSRRVLGRDGSGEYGQTREGKPMMERVRIKTGDWIVGLVLHTPGRPENKVDGIVGITALTNSKSPSFYRMGHTWGRPPRFVDQPIFPTGNRHFVGLVGRIDQDDRIIGLGLLQCTRFDEDDRTVPLSDTVREDYVYHLVESFQAVELGKCRCATCDAHGMRFWEGVEHAP